MSEASIPAERVLARHFLTLLAMVAVGATAHHYSYLLRGGAPRAGSAYLLALLVVGVALRPLLEPKAFRLVLLGLSMLGFAIWSKLDCLAIFGFAAMAITASRLAIPTALRVTLVMLAWFGALLPKLWLEPSELLLHQRFYIFLAGMPFAAVYLVIERSRGSLAHASWTDDALYLLALPRALNPFMQAISPSLFLSSQSPRAISPKLALRGGGLLLFGVALYVLMAKFPYIYPPRPDVLPDPRFVDTWRGPHNAVFIYANNASAIFCAVGLFRLLGFDLPSGFRWPLLAESMADFYRRWNHYVYDGIKSLLLFPLLGRLRLVLPPALATVVSGYLAIFLGSYCLNAILAPLALDPSPERVLAQAFDPSHLLVLGLFWSAILLPQLLPRRPAKPGGKWLPRLVKRGVFLGLLLMIAHLANQVGVALL